MLFYPGGFKCVAHSNTSYDVQDNNYNTKIGQSLNAFVGLQFNNQLVDSMESKNVWSSVLVLARLCGRKKKYFQQQFKQISYQVYHFKMKKMPQRNKQSTIKKKKWSCKIKFLRCNTMGLSVMDSQGGQDPEAEYKEKVYW